MLVSVCSVHPDEIAEDHLIRDYAQLGRLWAPKFEVGRTEGARSCQ